MGYWRRDLEHDWVWDEVDVTTPTVEYVEPAPIGFILGPDGQPVAAVLPDRQPFGFVGRGA